MISQLDEQTLGQLNNKILNFFKIDPNEVEKNERLKEAISYYQRYGNSITTGNGYVDILLLMSVIVTSFSVLAIIIFNII